MMSESSVADHDPNSAQVSPPATNLSTNSHFIANRSEFTDNCFQMGQSKLKYGKSHIVIEDSASLCGIVPLWNAKHIIPKSNMLFVSRVHRSVFTLSLLLFLLLISFIVSLSVPSEPLIWISFGLILLFLIVYWLISWK